MRGLGPAKRSEEIRLEWWQTLCDIEGLSSVAFYSGHWEATFYSGGRVGQAGHVGGRFPLMRSRKRSPCRCLSASPTKNTLVRRGQRHSLSWLAFRF